MTPRKGTSSVADPKMVRFRRATVAFVQAAPLCPYVTYTQAVHADAAISPLWRILYKLSDVKAIA